MHPRIPARPNLRHERAAGGLVCGIDEAGYSPLAGPVVAAAVVLPVRRPRRLQGLTDSKLLSRGQREGFFEVLVDCARVGVGRADVAEIDRLNIYQANLLAMQRAVADLDARPDAAIVDGRAAPALACRVHTLVKGDRRSLSVAAASVIAKVTRDRMMRELALRFPGYGWATNVGYGTDEHYLALLRKGPTPHHRRSFTPTREWFVAGKHPGSHLRFVPVPGASALTKLTLLALRRDLKAVFDDHDHHVGLLKNTRTGWSFQAVGYGPDGEPALGAGPFARCHGRPLAAPESRLVRRLLDSVP